MSEETQKPLEHPFYLLLDEKVEELSKPTYSFDGHSPLEYFGPINHVNILVGANNSGKSRFMRGVIKSKKIVHVEKLAFKALQKSTCDLLNIIEDTLAGRPLYIMPRKSIAFSGQPFGMSTDSWTAVNQGQFAIKNISHHIQQLHSYLETTIDDSIILLKMLLSALYSHGRIHSDLPKNTFNLESTGSISMKQDPVIYKVFHAVNESGLFDEASIFTNILINKSHDYRDKAKNIYTPLLRTAHSVYQDYKKVNPKDFFAETVHTNYFNGLEPRLNDKEHHDLTNDKQIIKIYTGMNLHKQMRKTRNSNYEKRKMFEAFEEFIGTKFFGVPRVDIISQEHDDGQEHDEHIVVNITGPKDERALHHLGDGIQTLITILYNIFTVDDNTWHYIEEPEIHLHPGLQRTFLEAVIDQAKKKNLTVFFTTHSNHLLDIAIEQDAVSIFTFNTEKNGTRAISNVVSGQNDILRSLGVNNSSVFMANCSIWVEGHTDRKYIKRYLELYIKNEKKGATPFIEDLDFTFLEYAGSNIVHYLFEERDPNDEHKNEMKALSISNNILLIADLDGENKNKVHEARQEVASKIDGFDYLYIKGVREIENLLSKEVLEQVLPIVYDKITDADAEKIRTSKEIKPNKRLGETFLGIYGKGKWLKSYGHTTIGYKSKLVEEAVPLITWGNMTKEAKQLAEEVYNFIAKNKKSN